MTSAVVLTMPTSRPALETHSQQILRGMNAASEQALVTGKSTAFGFSQFEYGAFHFKDGQWEVLADTPLPSDLDMKITKEENQVKLGEELQPIVIFDPTGLSTPFTLTLSDYDYERVIKSTGDGRVSLVGAP